MFAKMKLLYSFEFIFQEIVEALQSQCNIIPILDNFQWPEPETLPEDMRAVCYFNGVRYGLIKMILFDLICRHVCIFKRISNYMCQIIM